MHCRECKYKLVEGIGHCLFQHSRFWLNDTQVIVISGCFNSDDDNLAWIIKPNDLPQPEPLYYTNAEEADLRVWKHAYSCNASNVLIYSPDTDAYTIGLQVAQQSTKHYIVQLNLPSSREKLYVHIDNLLNAFNNDSDLSFLPSDTIPKVITCLFLATGSDYTSFFRNFAKSTVLNIYFYSQFISGVSMPGSLSETNTADRDSGFLPFLRPVF